MADIIISKPENGRNVVITAEQDNKFLLSFETDDAKVQRVDGDLVLDFGQGTTVTISGFYTVSSSGTTPALVLNGEEISTEEFFEAMAAVLQPASGEQPAQVQSGGSSLIVERIQEIQEENTLNGVDETSEEADPLSAASTLVNSLLADDAAHPLSLDNSFDSTNFTALDESGEVQNTNSSTAGGPQVYRGTSGDDVHFMEPGVGFAYGFAGNDELHGNTGDDWLSGGAGNDLLYGGAGDDILFGDLDDVTIEGGFGDDVIVLGNIGFNDIFSAKADGGDGIDILLAGVDSMKNITDIAGTKNSNAGIEMYVLGASEDMLKGMSSDALLQNLGMTKNANQVSFDETVTENSSVNIAGADYRSFDVLTEDNVQVTVLVAQSTMA